MISDSSVKRQAQLEYRLSLSGKSILRYFFFAFNHDSSPYLEENTFPHVVINIFEEKIIEWLQLLSKSGFPCVAQFWNAGKGRGLSSCADPKAPAHDSPGKCPLPMSD